MVHRFELGAVAPVRWLSRAFHQTALPQETPFDGIGRDENVGRFRVEMVLSRSQETEALFGDLQVTGTNFHCGMMPMMVAVVFGSCAHTYLCVSKAFQNESPKTTRNFEFLGSCCAG